MIEYCGEISDGDIWTLSLNGSSYSVPIELAEADGVRMWAISI